MFSVLLDLLFKGEGKSQSFQIWLSVGLSDLLLDQTWARFDLQLHVHHGGQFWFAATRTSWRSVLTYRCIIQDFNSRYITQRHAFDYLLCVHFTREFRLLTSCCLLQLGVRTYSTSVQHCQKFSMTTHMSANLKLNSKILSCVSRT